MIDDNVKSFKTIVSDLYPDMHIETMVIGAVKKGIETKSINYIHTMFHDDGIYSIFVMNDNTVIIPVYLIDCKDYFKTVLYDTPNPTNALRIFSLSAFDIMDTIYFIVRGGKCEGIIQSYHKINNAYSKYFTFVDHRYKKLELAKKEKTGLMASIKKLLGY